jgi:CYTH domain-containing protein
MQVTKRRSFPMPTEIERKFIARPQDWSQLATGEHLRQGYLSRADNATVRVRIQNQRATLTIKSKTTGIARNEYEYEIPLADAQQLLQLCDGPLIEKTRYCIDHKGHVFEVDVFEGDNAGLIVAEVELQSADEPVALPDWIEREVSHDVRYFNSNLAINPFCNWRGT